MKLDLSILKTKTAQTTIAGFLAGELELIPFIFVLFQGFQFLFLRMGVKKGG